MKKTLAIAAVFLFIGVASSAMAYTFDMGDNSSVDGSAFSDPGLVMEYKIAPGLSSLTYELGIGESKTFKFATFWTKETAIHLDDKVPQDLTAHVDFDVPDLFGDVSGESVGTKGWFLFIPVEGWKITWDAPVTVTFGTGNTGSLTLELSDAKFSSLFGPDGMSCDYSADVWAKVTLNSEPVPEPATMFLLGSGLAGLAGARRLRKKNRE